MPPGTPRGDLRQTFPRHRRLLHAADFDNVFKNGQRSGDRFFTVLFHPNVLGQPRLGFAISKQKVRLAVGRNRLRRLVRESFRRRAVALPAVDLVVLARDATRDAGPAEIAASLDKHWRRITTTPPTGNSTT
ncbi:MAG: ribonuclease P protein component [Gammaproteobacteria bacterium]